VRSFQELPEQWKQLPPRPFDLVPEVGFVGLMLVLYSVEQEEPWGADQCTAERHALARRRCGGRPREQDHQVGKDPPLTPVLLEDGPRWPGSLAAAGVTLSHVLASPVYDDAAS